MTYSDDAMIAVLQKVQNDCSEGPPPYKTTLEGKNEMDCYAIAVRNHYITTSAVGILSFNKAGHDELNRLIELKKENEIEKERLALEYKNTAIAEESLKTAKQANKTAQRANCISCVAIIVAPILSCIVTILVTYLLSFPFCTKTKETIIIDENVPIEQNLGEGVITPPNLKPCRITL